MNARGVVAALLLGLLAAGGESSGQDKTAKGEPAGGGRHGWLGTAVEDVTPRVARENDLHVKSGAFVKDVVSGSPAEKAGIREEDVIVEFNGKPVEESDDLVKAVRATAPGDQVGITVYRGQDKSTMQVTVGKAPQREYGFSYQGPMHMRIPPIPPVPPAPHMRMFRMNELMGLSLRDLRGQLGEYFEAPNGKGVLVEEVDRESAGGKAGFKAGDVIIKVGKESVETAEDVADALRDVKDGEKVEVGILRKGAPKALTVESVRNDEESWNGFHSYRLEDPFVTGGERNVFKKEMQKLRERLEMMGSQIRLRMERLGRTLRDVTI